MLSTQKGVYIVDIKYAGRQRTADNTAIINVKDTDLIIECNGRPKGNMKARIINDGYSLSCRLL